MSGTSYNNIISVLFTHSFAVWIIKDRLSAYQVVQNLFWVLCALCSFSAAA
ncbi:hypothetical protein A2U01_0082193, partial [Trifolium medium]|nr:hypothetical protein [Trifolium medium]